MRRSLAGKVALVAGASRGAGRGIAVQLGAAGATVYVTGRTTQSQRSEMNRPETIEETATLVDEAGGRGIAVRVDHLVPEQVRALVTRIEDEQGALHVLEALVAFDCAIESLQRMDWPSASGNPPRSRTDLCAAMGFKAPTAVLAEHIYFLLARSLTQRRRFWPLGPLGIRAGLHECSDETQQFGVLRAMPAAAEEVTNLDLGHLTARRLVGFVPDEHAPRRGFAGQMPSVAIGAAVEPSRLHRHTRCSCSALSI
jgi:short chain dehydrogenase